MNQLESAILNLYEVFRFYPLKPKIEGCPHCELNSAESVLHERPLRELTWNDFGVYPFKAMTTFGDLEDFKHFLPRICELYIEDFINNRYGVFILFSKLDYASWKSWPTSEVSAVENFLASWHSELKTHLSDSNPDKWQVEEILEDFNEYGLDSLF